MNTAHVLPLVFAAIILIAIAAFWVVPRRRRNITRMDAENQYVVPRPTYARPVSTYKPPSETDMYLPPYPAPAHVAPGQTPGQPLASGHDDPVPSYEEAISQSRPGNTSHGTGNNTGGAPR